MLNMRQLRAVVRFANLKPTFAGVLKLPQIPSNYSSAIDILKSGAEKKPNKICP